MAYVALTCRWVICGVFLAAALTKVRNRASWEAFVSAVSELVPMGAAPLGALVVGVELAVAVLVALPATVTAGLLLATGTLVAFSIAIWSALRRGVAVACRCFGWSDAPVSQAHLVRNGVLIVLAVVGLVAGQAAGGAVLHPAGIAVGVAAALVLIVLVTTVDDLAWLLLRRGDAAEAHARVSPSGRA
ncbi:MAG TPA: MauE/DoxX family redox-associated membrane protein [Euzebyales bacterium]|nr:MauE/DoxX family redox-associated membrane protein [Euzebyales bacterium]